MADHFFSPDFERALTESIDEFNSLDAPEPGGQDLQMVANGIAHSDLMHLTETMLATYDEELQGDTEEVATALAAIIQIALFAGIKLERHRWEELERGQRNDWDNIFLQPPRDT